MNIKKQIQLSVVLSLILAVAISALIGVSYLNVQDLEEQEVLAADVLRGGYELSFIVNDYIINDEPQAALQWEERYAFLQSVISQLPEPLIHQSSDTRPVQILSGFL